MPCSQENLEILMRIAKKIAPKYRFPSYDIEDIEQEAIIIGLKAMPFHNATRGTLSTYLWVHLSNRLKTLKRDRYYRPLPSKCENPSCVPTAQCSICEQRINRNTIKKNLAAPVDIDDIQVEPHYGDLSVPERLEHEEVRLIIDEHLPMELRSDYLKMLDEVYVPKARRTVIEKEIVRILEEYYE